MALTGALQADFSDFVTEANKASAALGVMDAEAKKAGTTLAKTGTAIDNAGEKSSQLGSTLSSIAGAFGLAFSVEAVIGFGKEILATADRITRLSDQTGLTVEQIQRLEFTAGQAGNTLDDITQAASKLQVALDTEKGQKAIEALGLNFREFAALKPYDQLLQVSDALRGIVNPAERAQAAVELLGESGAKLLPTLASDMRAVGEAAMVSSDEQIAALDAAGDAIDRWATTAKTAAVGAAGGILLAGEQIAEQGLLKTLTRWVESPTTAVFLQQMTDIRTAAQQTKSALTAADLAEIERIGGFGPEPGQTPAERAAATRAEAKAQSELEQATKRLKESQAELNEVRKGSSALLASIAGDTLVAVQNDLKLGASQATVATVYGLSAAHIRAASEALKAQIEITAGLGNEFANVGTKVEITAETVIGKLKKMKDESVAYEAETRRMVDAAQQIAPPIAEAEKETQQLTVAFNQAASAIRMTASESIAAGKVLEQAYRDAGIFVGQQIATGGYQQSQRLAAGREVTGAGQAWGNTLNVNVNSTEASNVANSLVTEMRRQGVRF